MSPRDQFEAGWRACARWARRDDLLADIGSHAYQLERHAAALPVAFSPVAVGCVHKDTLAGMPAMSLADDASKLWPIAKASWSPEYTPVYAMREVKPGTATCGIRYIGGLHSTWGCDDCGYRGTHDSHPGCSQPSNRDV